MLIDLTGSTFGKGWGRGRGRGRHGSSSQKIGTIMPWAAVPSEKTGNAAMAKKTRTSDLNFIYFAPKRARGDMPQDRSQLLNAYRRCFLQQGAMTSFASNRVGCMIRSNPSAGARHDDTAAFLDRFPDTSYPHDLF